MNIGDETMKIDPKEDFIADLTEGFSKINDRKPNGRLYVSSSGYCARKSALDATMPDRYDFSGTSHAFMRIGQTMEQILLEGAYAKNKLLFADYKIPTTGLDVGGKVDGIVMFDNKITVAEIKSIAYLPKGNEQELSINPRFGQYVAQTSLYSAILGLPSILVFFSRFVRQSGKSNDLAIKVFNLGFDTLRLEKHIESLALASFAVDENVLPDIPSEFNQKEHCRFCDFQRNCWDDTPTVLDENNELLTNIEDKAKTFAHTFMSKEAILQRRNGILKHISMHGTEMAKKILIERDWNSLT